MHEHLGFYFKKGDTTMNIFSSVIITSSVLCGGSILYLHKKLNMFLDFDDLRARALDEALQQLNENILSIYPTVLDRKQLGKFYDQVAKWENLKQLKATNPTWDRKVIDLASICRGFQLVKSK